jgi:hypothetical protein
MPTIEFNAPLDEEGLEWIRYRFTTERGQVMTFTIQYETTVGDERMPVVRYDNAHGFAHRDLLDRRGRIIAKHPLVGAPTPKEALQIGERDILEHWLSYRQRFFGDQT